MSPEILQGSITFHQESFLKADMYSIGLVVWEMFSRTKINTETGIYSNLKMITFFAINKNYKGVLAKN